MPKTHNDIFDKIISLDSLYAANHRVFIGKKHNDVAAKANDRIEEVIEDLRKDLITMTWRSDPYRRFITRKEVKRRKIDEPSYRDRILHNAIVQHVRPYFEPKFIFDSYAVTPGKGQHKAVFRVHDFLRRAIRKGSVYVLQCDIHHYYESIDHDILFRLIKRTIRDKRLLEIWHRIIEGYSSSPGIGLPIGAVTSQLSANIYLNPLDHFIKDDLGWPLYVRYMDDFVLIANDKAALWSMLDKIRLFLRDKLHLELNPKTKIYKSTQSVDFAGYRIFHDHILARKRNVKAARKRFRLCSYKFRHGLMTVAEVRQRVTSFLGYMKHCDGFRTTRSTLKYLNLQRRTA